MATEIAAAYVTLIPSLKGANDSITKQLSGMNLTGAGNSMGASVGRGFSATFTGIVGGIAATVTQTLGSAISASLGSAVSRVDTINNFPKVMSNLGYSAEDASASIAKIQEELTGLPTTTDSMVSLVQSLAPITGGLDEATDVGLAFNNMLLASGRSTYDQSRAMLQYTQMLAKGKPDLMAWRTMQEVMPGQLNQMAKALLGAEASSTDLYDAMLDGKVSFEDFNEALLKLNSEGIDGFASFEQQARDATGGIATAMTNVRTAISRSVANIIQALGAENIAAVINDIGTAISNAGKAIVPFAEKVGEVFNLFYTTLKEEGFAAAFATLPGVVKAATIALGGFGAVFGAIGIGTKVFAIVQSIKGLGTAAAGLPVVGGFVSRFFEGFKDAKVAASVFSGLEGTLGGKAAAIVAAIKAPFSTLSTAFAGAGGGAKGLAAALKVVGTSLRTALFSPMGIVLGVVAALAAAFVYLWNTSEPFKSQIMDIGTQIMASLKPSLDLIMNTIQNLAVQVMPVIMQAVQAIIPVITQVVQSIVQVAAVIIPVIAQIVAVVVPVIAQIISLVTQVAATVIASILPVISTVLGAITQAMPMIQQIITSAMTVVQQIITTVWPIVQKVITSVMSVVQQIITSAWPAIQSLITVVMHVIQGVINTVWPIIEGVITAAMHVIQGVIDAVMAVIRGDWEGAWNIIKSALSNAWEAIKSGVKSGISAVMDFISELPGKIKNFFSDAGTWLLDAGKAILEGLWNGISGALDWLGGKLAGIGDFIAEHKGPESYDLKLLIPNGGWIMEGLNTGIERGLPALRDTLAGVAGEIQGFGSDIAPFDDVSADVRTWRKMEFTDDTESMDEVISLLKSYLPEMAKEKQLVMDTGVVAGALTPAIDKNLGVRNTRRAKGL